MNNYQIRFGKEEDKDAVTMKLKAKSIEHALSMLEKTWETEFITLIELDETKPKRATKAMVQDLFSKLIKDHELNMEGEPLYPDIYTFGEAEIVFEDEHISYLLAGYVASSIYDELERNLKAIGIQMEDSDGSKLTITTSDF